jgi:hypothetical protein
MNLPPHYAPVGAAMPKMGLGRALERAYPAADVLLGS